MSRLDLHGTLARLPVEPWLLYVLLVLEVADLLTAQAETWRATTPTLTAAECAGVCGASGLAVVAYGADTCQCGSGE